MKWAYIACAVWSVAFQVWRAAVGRAPLIDSAVTISWIAMAVWWMWLFYRERDR